MSIGPGARSSSHRLAPSLVMLLRLAAFMVVLAAIAWLTVSKRKMDRELEHARADLLHRWQKAAAGVSKKQHATVATARVWLKRASGPSNADWISNELVRPGAFSATLKRNMVYLRGSLDELKTPAGIEATLRESTKDAFIFCLLDPPESRDEKTVLSRVRTAYGGGAPMQEATRHVHRLGDALLGLPILRSEWRSNIEDAEDHQSLGHWKSTFDLAPLRGAQRAAKASLLLVVVDEPGATASTGWPM
jgi:hypothetical protein